MELKHFKLSEFDCRCCGENKMDQTFLEDLELFRTVMGFPFIVTSGYRCSRHNKSVSTTGENGPHTLGRAVDLSVSHERAYRILAKAGEFGFTGIGIHQRGPAEGRYIHLDTLPGKPGQPRPSIWTY